MTDKTHDDVVTAFDGPVSLATIASYQPMTT